MKERDHLWPTAIFDIVLGQPVTPTIGRESRKARPNICAHLRPRSIDRSISYGEGQFERTCARIACCWTSCRSANLIENKPSRPLPLGNSNAQKKMQRKFCMPALSQSLSTRWTTAPPVLTSSDCADYRLVILEGEEAQSSTIVIISLERSYVSKVVIYTWFTAVCEARWFFT